MRKLIYAAGFATLILLNLSLYSQKNFIESYVVTYENDTLFGEIDYQEWDINPSSVRFRQSEKPETQNLTPEDVKQFNVAEDIYVSRDILMNQSPDELEKLNYEPQPVMSEAKVFLRLLVSGNLNLYSYKDEFAREHYFIEGDSLDAVELINYRYYIEKEGRKTVWNAKKYIGQLNYYLRNCPCVVKGISNLDYREKDLVNKVSEYNQCGEDENLNIKKERKLRFEFGIVAGGDNTTLKFISDYHKELNDINLKYKQGYVAGASLNLIWPRNRMKWSIYNELLYRSECIFKGEYEQVNNDSDKTKTIFSVGGSYIKLVTLLRYQLPFEKIRPYINIGLSNSFAVKHENSQIREITFYTSFRTDEGNFLDFFRKYEQGIIVGLGTYIGNFSGEIRYEMGNGMSEIEVL